MDINDYKSNSNASKNEDRHVEKVVTGQVSTKKKNGITKFAGNIISEDAKNIKDFIFLDVLIPTFKKAISDIVTNGIDIILYGESRGRSNRLPGDRVSYRSYGQYYDDTRRATTQKAIQRPMSFSYSDLIFDSRQDAQAVLNQMNDILYSYGFVRVADLMESAGVTGNPYTDNSYGWNSLNTAEVMITRDGWIIKLPRPIPVE